ncbi:hypothetical protein FRC02_000951 [Tulasnella sp. 418]|nr:hypothetical protein FRC02_000951 [Tulasnella sp. 418]
MFQLYLFLAVLSLYLQRAVADTVIVGAQDPRIVYQNQTTWSLVRPGLKNCPGQMLTEKVGDYAEFEFEGDSIAVYGSVGIPGGVIGIAFDDVANYTVDRYTLRPRCNGQLFYESGIQFGPHRITLTLMQPQRLLIQSIRYTRPMKPTPHIPSVIATGAVAFIALLGAIALQLFKTRRWRSFNRRRAGDISYDASNLPPFLNTASLPSTAKTTSDSGTLQSTNATVNEK